MSRIKILPEILSNKIAAGEVIERPASVVKELVENALDAESTRIIIELGNAGKSLIRVSDNGAGMNRDEALLALERYATSKIHTDADLFEIRTLGFRGEALPSIASVSRFSVETRVPQADAGTRVVVDGGKIRDVGEIGAPAGTQMVVRDLFFNTPARRKFMKTASTEMGHIADTVARIALAWPGVFFRLIHNGKTVKNWPIADPADRVADVLGGQLRGALHDIHGAGNGVCAAGWAASAHMARSTSRGLYVYVNHRFIRSRAIQHAVMAGYGNQLMKGRFPVAVVFLTVPFDQVDVNVHPTKHEVRFANTRGIHQLVQIAVSTALQKADATQWAADDVPPVPAAEVLSTYDASAPEMSRPRPPVVLPSVRPTGKAPERPPVTPPTAVAQARHREPEDQASLWRRKPFADLRVIGQFHDTYILCESDNRELILIDQHAAHERVRYEQLTEKSAAGPRDVQRLLIPETIELGYEEAQVLQSLIGDLDDMGLEIEPFGGNTYVVKSVPAMLAGREVRPLIVEIVEKITDVGFGSGPEAALDQVRKLMACHHALRANQKLTGPQIQALLSQLDSCHTPSHCPHGRPTWIRWGLSEIEKSFRRIV